MSILDALFIIALLEIYIDDGGWVAWTYASVYIVFSVLVNFSDD